MNFYLSPTRRSIIRAKSWDSLLDHLAKTLAPWEQQLNSEQIRIALCPKLLVPDFLTPQRKALKRAVKMLGWGKVSSVLMSRKT